MITRPPRFEVIRTDSGWHTRYRASNGEVLSTSENYTTRRAAQRWVDLIGNHSHFEVRYIDLRTPRDKT